MTLLATAGAELGAPSALWYVLLALAVCCAVALVASYFFSGGGPIREFVSRDILYERLATEYRIGQRLQEIGSVLPRDAAVQIESLAVDAQHWANGIYQTLHTDAPEYQRLFVPVDQSVWLPLRPGRQDIDISDIDSFVGQKLENLGRVLERIAEHLDKK